MHDKIDRIRCGIGPAIAGRFRWLILAGTVAGLGACDDGNLFDGQGSGGPPTIEFVSPMLPDSARSGETIDFRVRARADRKVERIDVQFRRAQSKDTVLTISPSLLEVTRDIRYQIPVAISDTILVIRISATDVSGAVSEIRADTIRVRDVSTPTSSVTVSPTAAGAGDTLRIRISGEDNLELRTLGYLILNAQGDSIGPRELAQVAGSKTESTFRPVVPLSLAPGEYRVVGFATDVTGLVGTDTVAFRIVDRAPPLVSILRPMNEATFPVGDSILVEVRLTDNAGVSAVDLIGVAMRGDPSLGTDTVVTRFTRKTISFATAQPDTTVRRFLIATTDRTTERVHLIVMATDTAGNVGADTVIVAVGGPRVEIRSPATGQIVQAGRTVGVRLFASDPSRVSTIQLVTSGLINDTIRLSFSPARDSAVVDTAIALPAGMTGLLQLSAEAVNTIGISGRTQPVLLTVESSVQADVTRPFVSLAVAASPETGGRMELGDSIRVAVTARDNDGGSGIVRMGVTVLAINTVRLDTLTRMFDVEYPVPRSSSAYRQFSFVPFNVGRLELPDTVVFQVHAFAYDSAGNSACAVAATEQQLDCTIRRFNGNATDVQIAAGVVGQRAEVVVVNGRTVLLPDGGVIADAVVDTTRQRLYLSNFSFNKVDVLNLQSDAFLAPVRVGSQPWGLFLNRRRSGGTFVQDTLMVANSGGTNISYVSLTGTPREDVDRRLLTPNSVLFQILIRVDEATGRERYTGTYFDFSDRPQFLAQDSLGVLLYSTVPTGAAPDGTIRYAIADPVPGDTQDKPEVKILFNDDAVKQSDDNVVIAHVDSIFLWANSGGDDLVEIFDHVSGYPDAVITSGRLPLSLAVDAIAALGSDIYFRRGTWDTKKIGLSDTTFVSASGDRGWVAFGEGATSPYARVILWNANNASISNQVQVADLVNNAAERVQGVGLNENGSLGVVRGQNAAYFFTNDLRLQGVFSEGLRDGGAGAALHPSHRSSGFAADTSGLAFVGTNRKTVKIMDTFHFFEVGEVHIRDNIVGPLRASSPLPADRTDPACLADPRDCTVVKLYGVTQAGGVVIVNVRRRDLRLQ